MTQKVITNGEIKTLIGSHLTYVGNSDMNFCPSYQQIIGGSVVTTVDDNNKLYVDGYSVGVGTGYKPNQFVCKVDVKAKYGTLNSLIASASTNTMSSDGGSATLYCSGVSTVYIIDYKGQSEGTSTTGSINATFTSDSSWATVNSNKVVFAANTGAERTAKFTASYQGKTATVSITQSKGGSVTYSYKFIPSTNTVSPCVTSVDSLVLYVSDDNWSTQTAVTSYSKSPSYLSQNITNADKPTTISALINGSSVATGTIIQTKGITAQTIVDGSYTASVSPNKKIPACYEGALTSDYYTYTESWTVANKYDSCLSKSSDTAITSTTVTATPTTYETGVTPTTHTFAVSPTSLSFESGATGSTSSKAYNVLYDSISTTNYTVSTTDSWINTTEKGKIYTNTINTGSVRSGNVTIVSTTDTSKTATITITQAADTTTHTFTVKPSSITFKAAGGQEPYDVKYNGASTTAYTYSEQTGFTVSKTNQMIVAVQNISLPLTSATRTANITFTSTTDTSLTTSINVTQVGLISQVINSITAYAPSMSFTYNGGQLYNYFSVNVTYNYSDGTSETVDKEITYDSNTIVTFKTGTYFSYPSQHIVSAKANAEITEVTDTMTVSYYGKTLDIPLTLAASPSVLKVTPSEISFLYTGGESDFTVTYNDVVTTAYTTACTNNSFYINPSGKIAIGKNLTESAKTGTMTFTSTKDATQSDYIYLSQPAHILTISPTALIFPNTGGTQGYTVKYNGTELDWGKYSVSLTGDTEALQSIFSETEEIRTVANPKTVDQFAELTITYDDLSVKLPITLKASTITPDYWTYQMNASPKTLAFDGTGGTQNVTLTYEAFHYSGSTLIGTIGPVTVTDPYYSLETIGKNDFVINQTAVTAQYNSGDARTNKVTFSASGGTTDVNLTQASGTTAHTLSITPLSMTFLSAGGVVGFSVYYDGTELDSSSYTATTDNSQFQVYGGGTEIHANINNTGTIINGNLTVEYNDKTATVPITQSGGTGTTAISYVSDVAISGTYDKCYEGPITAYTYNETPITTITYSDGSTYVESGTTSTYTQSTTGITEITYEK